MNCSSACIRILRGIVPAGLVIALLLASMSAGAVAASSPSPAWRPVKPCIPLLTGPAIAIGAVVHSQCRPEFVPTLRLAQGFEGFPHYPPGGGEPDIVKPGSPKPEAKPAPARSKPKANRSSRRNKPRTVKRKPAKPTRSAESIAWENAYSCGDVFCYRRYLDAYPSGAHAKEAHDRIRRILGYPPSGGEPEIVDYGSPEPPQPQRPKMESRLSTAQPIPVNTKRLSESAAWKEAYSCGDVFCYSNYLDAFPNGAHANEARNRIRRIMSGAFR
jgi:hypothetical protein